MDEEALRVNEVMAKAYQVLVSRHQAREIIFPKPIVSEIADDSDGHRTRIGYMCYDKLALLALDGRVWALGVGKKPGDYPGGEYTCDMLALESKVMESSVDELAEQLLPKAMTSTLQPSALVRCSTKGTKSPSPEIKTMVSSLGANSMASIAMPISQSPFLAPPTKIWMSFIFTS